MHTYMYKYIVVKADARTRMVRRTTPRLVYLIYIYIYLRRKCVYVCGNQMTEFRMAIWDARENQNDPQAMTSRASV